MIGASFGGALNANSLHVDSSQLMRSNAQNKAGFKYVNLRGAEIKGQIDMTGASFDGELNANALQVGGSLFMASDGQNKASFKDVVLTPRSARRRSGARSFPRNPTTAAPADTSAAGNAAPRRKASAAFTVPATNPFVFPRLASGRAVGPADGAEHGCHLGKAAKNTVLLLQELCRLADRDSGERRSGGWGTRAAGDQCLDSLKRAASWNYSAGTRGARVVRGDSYLQG
jgi:hypothetical protein